VRIEQKDPALQPVSPERKDQELLLLVVLQWNSLLQISNEAQMEQQQDLTLE
jgi:hypothetical protein